MQQHFVNVFFGEASQKSTFAVQQGDYNSRNIVCDLWQKALDGEKQPMNTSDVTIMAVFAYGRDAATPEYLATIVGENRIEVTIPSIALSDAGSAAMQLRAYGNDTLLSSAVVPFRVLDSIAPSVYFGDEDVEPSLLGVLTQVRETMQEYAEAEKEREEAEAKRVEAEAEREEKFKKFENIAHEHPNKEILDTITFERVQAWDTAKSDAETYTNEVIAELVSKLLPVSLAEIDEICGLTTNQQGS